KSARYSSKDRTRFSESKRSRTTAPICASRWRGSFVTSVGLLHRQDDGQSALLREARARGADGEIDRGRHAVLSRCGRGEGDLEARALLGELVGVLTIERLLAEAHRVGAVERDPEGEERIDVDVPLAARNEPDLELALLPGGVRPRGRGHELERL